MKSLYWCVIIVITIVFISHISLSFAESLHEAATNGDINKVKNLISKGADVNKIELDGTTPLHMVAFGGAMPSTEKHKEVANLLIFHGADVNAKNIFSSTPLHNAAFNDRFEIAKLLIEHGANINTKREDGATPLNLAKSQNNTDILRLLIKNGGFENPNFHSERLPTAKDLFELQKKTK